MGWAAARASGDDWPQPAIKQLRPRINVVVDLRRTEGPFCRWDVANNVAIHQGDYQLTGGAAKPSKDSETNLLDLHSVEK